MWQKVQVPEGTLCLTVLMAAALANCFSLQENVRLAVGILLALQCSIRIPGRDCTGVLALPLTKGGQRRGCQEMVTLDDTVCGFWMHVCIRVVVLYQAWKAQLSAPIERMLSLLYLSLVTSSSHTHHDEEVVQVFPFAQHQDIKRTMMRGRWCDLRIAEGAALLTQVHLPRAFNKALGHHRDMVFCLDDVQVRALHTREWSQSKPRRVQYGA